MSCALVPWGAMLASHVTISCMVCEALSPPSLCVFTSTPLHTECRVVTLISSGWGSVSCRVRRRKIAHGGFRFRLCQVRVLSLCFSQAQVPCPALACHHSPSVLVPNAIWPHTWMKQPKRTMMHASARLTWHLGSWRWPE